MNINKSAPLRSDDFWMKNMDIDAGVFDHAAQQGKTFSMLLEEQKASQRDPSPYLGLTKAEVVAVKKEYRKLGKIAPLTALEECYKQLGIKVSGSFTDKVDKFYAYDNAEVIFAEFWSDRIYAGLLQTSIVSELVMSESVIDSDNFHKVYLETLEQNRQLRRVGEYEEFPEIQIKVGEQSVMLQPFGAYVTVSYKAMKQQRINIFAKGLEQIGLQIGIDETDDLARTARLGDGNSNTPGTTVTTVTTGNIVTRDVINWATALPTPYKMDKFITRKALLQEYSVTLSDFDNPVATWGFMGIDIPRSIEWDRSSIPTDNFIGFDSRYAIEHITNGAVLVESEKIIRKQINGTAVSHAGCFSVFDADAIAIFDETH